MENWALITGASAGIGRELALVFANKGYNLALVARNESRLKELAAELHGNHRVETRVIAQDLSKPDAASLIFHQMRDVPLAILVNNAGFGKYGRFDQVEAKVHLEMMQVNITALIHLTHLFVQPMIARGSGRILNVASTAAFQPGPMMNIYYATKAFVYSFSYALADELSGTGVTVTALCPGMTLTEFQERANLRKSVPWAMSSARAVAEAGYEGVIKGKRVVIPGVMNQIASFLAKRSPAWLTSAVVRKVHKT